MRNCEKHKIFGNISPRKTIAVLKASSNYPDLATSKSKF
jgi:hypothetical protein